MLLANLTIRDLVADALAESLFHVTVELVLNLRLICDVAYGSYSIVASFVSLLSMVNGQGNIRHREHSRPCRVQYFMSQLRRDPNNAVVLALPLFMARWISGLFGTGISFV